MAVAHCLHDLLQRGREGDRCDLAGGDAGTGTRETGTKSLLWQGSSYEQGQRQEVRQAEDTAGRQEQIAACLFMAAMSAAKFNPVIHAFYQRLIEKENLRVLSWSR